MAGTKHTACPLGKDRVRPPLKTRDKPKTKKEKAEGKGGGRSGEEASYEKVTNRLDR